MDPREPFPQRGALSLLKECRENVEALFARFESAKDSGTRKTLIAAVLYELKIHAVIAELLPQPSRRNVHDLIAGSIRRRLHLLPLGAALLGAASAGAQSNQGGGEQLNPNTSLESIISGGPTGQTTPIDKVIVPVTPAGSQGTPASNGKDRTSTAPLRASKRRVKKRPSDRALARKIRGRIVHDVTLPQGSKNVKVAAAAGKVTLTGTVLTEDDKYKIAAKAAVLVGPENVVNLIAVQPAVPHR